MRSSLTVAKQTIGGFSVVELLLIIVMISVVAGFAIVSIVQRNRTSSRKTAAIEIATQLQKARLDSMKRNARDVNQMAQLKIFNRSSYSVAIDGDGDGYLDVPLVMSLPAEQGVEISGPFPKTFIFDWLGQTVDSQNHRVRPPLVTVGAGSAANSVRFTEIGDIVVVPARQ